MLQAEASKPAKLTDRHHLPLATPSHLRQSRNPRPNWQCWAILVGFQSQEAALGPFCPRSFIAAAAAAAELD